MPVLVFFFIFVYKKNHSTIITAVQLTFIKQLNSECYNMCKKVWKECFSNSHSLTLSVIKRSCMYSLHIRLSFEANAHSHDKRRFSQQGCNLRHNTGSFCIVFFFFVCPSPFSPPSTVSRTFSPLVAFATFAAETRSRKVSGRMMITVVSSTLLCCGCENYILPGSPIVWIFHVFLTSSGHFSPCDTVTFTIPLHPCFSIR